MSKDKPKNKEGKPRKKGGSILSGEIRSLAGD